MTISWRRSGSTSSTYTHQGYARCVRITSGHIKIRFDISAAGGGTTELEVFLHPDHFLELSKLMYPARDSENLEALLSLTKQSRDSYKRQAESQTREIDRLRAELVQSQQRETKELEYLRGLLAESRHKTKVLDTQNARLHGENERMLNESVDYRARVIEAIEKVPLKETIVIKLEEWLAPQPETDISLYAESFRS